MAFCDASMVGYGCCVYLHITDPFGNISVRLLCAESKVSPVKVTILARLELVAAVLLSNLVRVVKERLETRISVSDLFVFFHCGTFLDPFVPASLVCFCQ